MKDLIQMAKLYRLECKKNGHDKFYEIIHEKGIVVKRWGRIGTEGQMMPVSFGNSDTAATNFVNLLFDSKRSKGYVLTMESEVDINSYV